MARINCVELGRLAGSRQRAALPSPQNGTERSEASEKVRVIEKQYNSQETQRISPYA